MKRTSEEYILMTLSFGGAISITPFAIYRMLHGDWVVAFVDSTMVIGMLMLGAYVYWSKRIEFASVTLSALALIGMVMVVHLKGHTLIYWAYPTLVGVFYLLQPRLASLFTLIAIIALAPALFREMDIVVFIAAMMTLVVIVVFAYVFASRMHEQRKQLSLLIRKDPLTGVGNRRALEENLNEYTVTHQRTEMTASLIMLDLDYFKNINDVYGHMVGDQVLIKIAEIINSRIRISDKLFRFGGEEFVIIAIGTSSCSALTLAEDLRNLIESAALLPNAVTISLGVAEYKRDETGENWMHRCDGALYEAKNLGRNRVCCAV